MVIEDELLDSDIQAEILPEEGSVEALDMFNAPPPGHSLTDEPQKWAWENPPQYTDPEEAMSWVLSKIENPQVEENFVRLMASGVPIESITNTITFAGFTEGYWTPDLSEILKIPITAHFIGLAQEANIPATIFNVDPKTKEEQERISDEDVLKMMKENRPDMYDKVMYATDVLLEDSVQTESDDEVSVTEEPESFMEMEEESIEDV
tara:strand:+ start:2491 stop:3111 length:621 start_codon:yes stop_codon:yes gene_type:complete